MAAGCSSRAASITCASIGWPAIGCSTLGNTDFIRLPAPAARMITCNGWVMGKTSWNSARILIPQWIALIVLPAGTLHESVPPRQPVHRHRTVAVAAGLGRVRRRKRVGHRRRTQQPARQDQRRVGGLLAQWPLHLFPAGTATSRMAPLRPLSCAVAGDDADQHRARQLYRKPS